jgi:hypothetical protein
MCSIGSHTCALLALSFDQMSFGRSSYNPGSEGASEPLQHCALRNYPRDAQDILESIIPKTISSASKFPTFMNYLREFWSLHFLLFILVLPPHDLPVMQIMGGLELLPGMSST